MTLKALAALNWIAIYCRQAAYSLKADDDAFVNVFAALHHLHDLQSIAVDRQHRRPGAMLLCLVWHKPPVARSGKWNVSRREFPGSRYPDYCFGVGYIVTLDVVDLLLAAAAAGEHPRENGDVTAAGSPRPYNDVTTVGLKLRPRNDSSGVTDGDAGVSAAADDVVRNSRMRDVTADRNDTAARRRGGAAFTSEKRRRLFWIDDVYVTGMMVESLRGRVRHTDMRAAYCRSDTMAAIYRNASEWYKYIFTEVSFMLKSYICSK